MKRRDFITLLGGAAAAWPLASRAQQTAQIPHVGWIWPGAAAGNPTELAGFKQGLRELGYVEGRNIARHDRLCAYGHPPNESVALADRTGRDGARRGRGRNVANFQDSGGIHA